MANASSDRGTSPYLLPVVMIVLAITAVFVAWRLAQPALPLPPIQPVRAPVARPAPPPAPPPAVVVPDAAVAALPPSDPAPGTLGPPKTKAITLSVGGVQTLFVAPPEADAPGIGDDLLLPDPAPPPRLPVPPPAPPPSAWKVVSTADGPTGTLASDDTVQGRDGSAVRPTVVAGCTAGRRYLVFDPGVEVTPTEIDGEAYLQAVVIWPDGNLDDVKLDVRRNSTAGLFPTPQKWIARLQGEPSFAVSYQGADGAPIEVEFTNREVEALTAGLAGCK